MSAETPTEWLPRLIALGTIEEGTRMWAEGMESWEEWRSCNDIFEIPDEGEGSVSTAMAALLEEAAEEAAFDENDGWGQLLEVVFSSASLLPCFVVHGCTEPNACPDILSVVCCRKRSSG